MVDGEVDTYSEITATTEVPFPTDYFADEIFGGFKNEVFYDYFKLFIAIIFVVFCIKIFGIFFSR